MPRTLTALSVNNYPALPCQNDKHVADIENSHRVVPRLLTQKEASALTRMSEKWFERDRWIGCTIPFVKIGRSVRYRAEDIAAYIEANTQKAVQ